ncbi:PREDICTED: phytanoyl-CoA dioxygenase, peroxisomal-like [Branchiostoma belcheri]|uniref:Phytanoyl-CoA dioxygenase, peroxisomal n=1 Tax=Branchiostoma belcheri TaxID=7741 RepID=A0A6P4ZXG1_BRABE|nr:PREDICTED: phytanoyl-CoA dioxygenase, peroxisomal-like [Branchiostoma belcheri]
MAANRLQTIAQHLAVAPAGGPTVRAVPTSGGLSSVPTSQEFRYTVDGGALSHEQRKFYEENGFIVIRNLISDDKLDVYRQHFEAICRGEVTVPGLTIMKDISLVKSKAKLPKDSTSVTKIQSFQDDPVLMGYCADPEILQYVESFSGPNISVAHTMLINKPPDPGSKSSRHPLHQDMYYFPWRPTDRVVCAWTAMEHVDRSNGCLVVLPGSHREGTIKEHGYPQWEGGVNYLYHGILDFDEKTPRVHLEMEKGDTVFFHPILIHGSGMNRTKGFRKAISGHYFQTDSTVIDVTGTVQEKAIRETIQMLLKQRRLGKDHPFNKMSLKDMAVMTTKGRRRVVKGEPLPLQY